MVRLIKYKEYLFKYSIVFTVLLIISISIGGPENIEAKEHVQFTKILKRHVRNGFVNYGAIKKDIIFNRYIRQLQNTNPEAITNKNKKLAFWINAYNAHTIQVILENYPVKSIIDLHSKYKSITGIISGGTVWNQWKFKLHKREYSLDDIEHKIIRKKFKEPRIHAALVCAAQSCPPLRNEAYEGKALDNQLSSQMRQWLGNKKLNYYDAKSKILYLSKILDWYQKDFVSQKSDLIGVLHSYLPAKARKDIQKLKLKEIQIKYLPYNWQLNGK